MKISLSDISGLMAVQHRILKGQRKKTDLRQRDWEVLFACYRLSLAQYPFTAAKVQDYMEQAYFLPCLYDSIKALVEKAYIKVVIPAKPFKPESYQLTYKGVKSVSEFTEGLQRLFEEKEVKLIGRGIKAIW